VTIIKRTIDAGTLAAITAQHTQPIHIVQLQFQSEFVYLSEGPEVVYGGNTYLEGRVKVSNLSWTGDGVQTCTLEILNEDNYASVLFLQNKIADVLVTIWTVYRNPNGTFTTPVLYVVGTGDDSELGLDALRLTIASSRFKTKFFPNTYMGSAGFTHIPAEGTVVFWNGTTYVLERDYG
jgi:hypothetical protein